MGLERAPVTVTGMQERSLANKRGPRDQGTFLPSVNFWVPNCNANARPRGEKKGEERLGMQENGDWLDDSFFLSHRFLPECDQLLASCCSSYLGLLPAPVRYLVRTRSRWVF